METVTIDTQWRGTFMAISKDEINSPSRIDSDDFVSQVKATCGNMKHKRLLSEKEKEFLEQRKRRMMRMQPLFASQPRLKKICRDWRNQFVDSGFTTYHFPEPIKYLYPSVENDLKYLISLCGCNLTKLSLYYYHRPTMMQLIKYNCPNLTTLIIRFREADNDEDFDNVFCNMNRLERLIIHWHNHYEILPMTLIKSLDHVRDNLKTFSIVWEGERLRITDKLYAPDSPIFLPETQAFMNIIGNMKNLEFATIKMDYSVTDELLINLTNNCKNLIYLNARSSRITDNSLIELNNLKKIKYFRLGLNGTDVENKFITDLSIRCLFNQTLKTLDISNCINVTNNGIIDVVQTLPNLRTLHIENTKATVEVVDKIAYETQNRELSLFIHVSFEMPQSFFVINQAVRFISSYKDVSEEEDDEWEY